MPVDYLNPGPTREEIDATKGPILLEFGTGWCGYCQAAAPHITAALAQFPAVDHIKVEDGPGRPLVPGKTLAHRHFSQGRRRNHPGRAPQIRRRNPALPRTNRAGILAIS